MDSNHVTRQLHFSRSFHLQPVVSSDMFSCPFYPLSSLTCSCSSMDHAWIVTMLPRCYIFPLFPSVTRYIFSRAYLWLVLVTSMDSIHVASYMFSRVFLLLSVLFFSLSPSSSDCFREFFIISFVFDRPVFNSIFIVLQILQQFPTAFEFIPMYLVRIAEHVNSQW